MSYSSILKHIKIDCKCKNHPNFNPQRVFIYAINSFGEAANTVEYNKGSNVNNNIFGLNIVLI